MHQYGLLKVLKAFGPEANIAYVKWAPSSAGTQTLTEAHGVSSVHRTGTLVDLIELTNELQTDYTAHLSQGVHATDDATNVEATANATDEASAIALANALKASYNAHLVETDVHVTDDVTNDVTSADATDEASLVTLVNEIKADYNVHIADTDYHEVADGANAVATANASNTATAITLVNALKAAYNLHLSQHVHASDDATNTLSEPASSDLDTAIAALNELKAAYTAHIASEVFHDNADATNIITEPDASDRLTASALAMQLQTALGGHLDRPAVHQVDDTANVTSYVLTNAGSYVVNLTDKSSAIYPIIGYEENDTTHFHWLDVPRIDPANKTVDIRHRRGVYATVASGPTGSDTVDFIQGLFIQAPLSASSAPAKKPISASGPRVTIAYARFTPAASPATQTLTEAQGIRSVVRTGAGAWTVTLAGACEAMLVFTNYIENDTTNYHFVEPTGTTPSSGTCTVRHGTMTYANVASGWTASDTVDEIEILVVARVAT